jgi:signal transduction histidine kinase
MANNEILMSHPDSTIESQQKWLESTKAEGEYMKSLVDRMLELARTETISDKLELSEIDISELTEGIILQLEPIAFDSGVTINSRITPEIVLKTNPSELSRLIHILVDNAIKYSHEGNEVSVFLIYNKKDIELCVNNHGDIIPKESLAHIFDRFYRTDDARTKGGFGLGLSIAKNITSALGGQISASSSEENGTTFSVRFKR